MDSPATPDTSPPEVSGVPDTSPPEASEVPDISEYWPDAPHPVGPPADDYEPEGAEAVRTSPAWQPKETDRRTVELALGMPTVELRLLGAQQRAQRPLGKTLAAVLAGILAAGAGGWAAFGSSDSPEAAPAPSSPQAVDQPDPPANPPVSIEATPPTVPAPAAATFELADGATALNVTIGDTGDAWFRVTSPEDGAIKPRTEVDGATVRVFVETLSQGGQAVVDVVLSPAVTWSILMRGGVRTGAFDLTGGQVSRIDLVGGAAALEFAMPAQDTLVPISMSGGVNDWRISTPGEVPVRATLQDGGGAVSLYGDRNQGIDRGKVFTVAGDGAGGIDVTAEKGVGTLTVTAGPVEGTIGE